MNTCGHFSNTLWAGAEAV